MLGKGKELAHLQSDFYRDKFRKTLNWLIICVVIMFILIAAIVYTIFFRPEPNYYANTTEGIILPMPPPKTA